MMALTASCIGGIVSTFTLIFVSPLLSKIALKFGPAEYFSLAIFGLSIISGVSGKSIFKGLLMGCLGMFVIMIGMDPMDGIQRLTFGNLYLAGGIDMIPALIGLFALSAVSYTHLDVYKRQVRDTRTLFGIQILENRDRITVSLPDSGHTDDVDACADWLSSAVIKDGCVHFNGPAPEGTTLGYDSLSPDFGEVKTKVIRHDISGISSEKLEEGLSLIHI